jgi:hypothetical protein
MDMRFGTWNVRSLYRVGRGRSRKLSNQWLGPYEIFMVEKVNAIIKRGRKFKKDHINRLKPFY